MTTVLLALHLIITAALIFVILLQKTEGNAAGGGMGGGVSLSAMMQPRSRPNPLTRATAILAVAFFSTSLGLALLAKNSDRPTSIMTAPASEGGPTPNILDSIETAPAAETPPSVPTTDQVPAPAPAAPSVPN